MLNVHTIGIKINKKKYINRKKKIKEGELVKSIEFF